ncbi:MAG: hypothetical protein ABSG89_08610 [Bacteroidales bacterium]
MKTFILLPFNIHKSHEQWVPPLLVEEWSYFNQKKNPAFQKNDAILLLAYMDDKPVGRIMGVINLRRNNRLSERVARFGYLECYNDTAVMKSLLQSIENWASGKGMNKIIGPMGFSDQDPEGFLVEGFQYEPTISTYYNFEYIPPLIEKCGYLKEIDYVVYRIDLTKAIPGIYNKIVDRLYSQGKFEFPEIRKKKELKSYLRPVLQVMNDTFADLYGYDPLTDDEIDAIGKKFLPVIDPKFVKIACRGNSIAGFVLGIPNLNYGFRKAKGKLFPLGLFYLFKAPGKTRQFDLLLGAVRSEFRGSGLDAYGMISIIQAARQAGYTIMDSHHELENNLRVRSEMERMGGELDKRFRIYQKQLI